MVRGWLRWLLVVVGVVIVVVVAAVLLLPRLVDTPRMQAWVAQSASRSVGRPVTFQGISVSVLPRPSVVLRQLEVAEDPAFGRNSFLRLDRAEVRLRLRPLLLGRVELGDFVLKEPDISLVQSADGRWNIATLGPAHGEPRGGGRDRPAGGGARLLPESIPAHLDGDKSLRRDPGPAPRFHPPGRRAIGGLWRGIS